METSKIELQRERDFGEIFNTSFTFVRQEIKPFGMAILVFIIPTLIVLTLFSKFQSASLVMYNRFWGSILSLIIALIMQTVIFSTVYSYLNLYFKKFKDITIKELFIEIKYNFFRVLWALIVTVTLIVLVVLLGYWLFANAAPSLGIILGSLIGCYLLVSLSMLNASLIFEDIGFGSAFSRSFQLSHMKWWGTFLILLIGGVILIVIILILQSPVFVLGIVGRLHNNYGIFENFSTMLIIYSNVATALGQVFYIIPAILAAFQYFNLVEMREKPSLREKINELGKDE